MSDFTGQSLNGRTQSTDMPFGTLDYNEIVVRIASEDQPKPNYTIKLTPPDSVENSREFLVLIGEEEGYRGYIMQYQTTEENSNTLYNAPEFTGEVNILDFDRELYFANSFENGLKVSSSGGRSESGGCTVEFEYITEPYQIESGLWSTRVVVNTHIHCPSTIVDSPNPTGNDGGGRTFLPGEPVGSDPGGIGGGGGGGGGSGGSGDPIDTGGIEDPGDHIGTIIINIPAEFIDILHDQDFMAAMTDILDDLEIASLDLDLLADVPYPIFKKWQDMFNQFARNQRK